MKQKSYSEFDLVKLDAQVNQFEETNDVKATQCYGVFQKDVNRILHIRVLFYNPKIN